MCLQNIDLLISGHTHKPALLPPIGRIIIGDDILLDNDDDHRTDRLVCTSYLDFADYAVRGEYTPCPFVNQLAILHDDIKDIEFRFRRKI